MAVNIRTLINEFETGKYTERLRDIYADDSVLEYQAARYVRVLQNYLEQFGEDEVEIYSAPGRSEVGGNHTDHQHGQVLACSINLDIIAVVTRTDDNRILVKSDGYPMIHADAMPGEPDPAGFGTSEALISGVAARFRALGFRTGGFRAYMTSDVLSGSGLSSSAAFEVAIGNILSGLYNEGKIDPVAIAIISQYAENVYFGKPSGLMDQMACSVGGLINIDFRDPADPVIRRVHVDFGEYRHSLCISDTKGSHADLTPDYAAIPAEMKSVAAFFGKEVLREVEEEDVLKALPAIREKCGDRAALRAIHFYEDHKRVGRQVEALESGDFEGFKALIKESGDSSYKYLQNVFSVKDVNSQGLGVALALSDLVLKEKGVSRVHGGGFAGTIQAFVPDDLVPEYRNVIDSCFGDGSCHVLKVRKYGGIRVV